MDADEARRFATLARISLSEEQLRKLAAELTTILQYFDKLQEVPTSEKDLLGSSASRSALREDRAQAWANPQQLVNAARDHEDDFFVVPRILE